MRLTMPRLTPAQLKTLAREMETDFSGYPTPRGWAKVGKLLSQMNFISEKTQQERA